MTLMQDGTAKTHADWGKFSLSELYDFKNGVNADRGAYGRGIPFINVLEPITYSHLRGDEISGRVSLPEAMISAYEVRNGDLLFNRTSEVDDEVGLAAAYLSDERVVFGGFVIRARPISSLLDSRFAAYALRAPAVRTQIVAMGQGAVRSNIGQENLRRVELRIPPMREQHAIAAALTDADALIDSLEQELTKKRQIKQGAMQELLTGKRRLLPGAETWRQMPLGNLGKWSGGMTPSMAKPDYWSPQEVPWLSSGDLKTARLSESTKSISKLAVSDGATTVIPAKSVVLVMRSGILRKYLPVGMTLKTMAINQDLKAVQPNDDVVPEFLLHSLTYFGERILATCLKAGTTVESIEFRWLKQFIVDVPSMAEQETIACVLSDMDVEIAALEFRLAKARDLKQAMAQSLLTGRIRLLESTA